MRPIDSCIDSPELRFMAIQNLDCADMSAFLNEATFHLAGKRQRIFALQIYRPSSNARYSASKLGNHVRKHYFFRSR